MLDSMREARGSPFDFPASPFAKPDIIRKWRRCVCARENVFVHEQAPNQILILPGLSDACNLEMHDAVILQHIATLSKKVSNLENANMLGHLQASNLVVFGLGHVAIVHAVDLRVRYASLRRVSFPHLVWLRPRVMPVTFAP